MDVNEVRAETIQHDRHAAQCSCGRVHVADAPPGAGQPGTVTYGLNFQAWYVFLMTAEHLTLLRRGVAVGLSEVRRSPCGKQPAARMLLECVRHRKADVLRFLTGTAVPRTSNQAERDLRPSKTQQKISGRLRSEKTTRDRYAIRGYASTAAKHGVEPCATLAGHPGETRLSAMPVVQHYSRHDRRAEVA